MAVDSEGNVYVADFWNSRIQKFTADGVFLAKWGSEGSGDGQFGRPSGLAVDAAGNVYVADSVNNRIQKFTADGAFLAKWGSKGSGDGQFSTPRGLAVDTAGNVLVVDSGYRRIQKFTADGVFLAKWGSWGSGDGQFNWPTDVAVDAEGNVYVADSGFGNSRIQKFTADGVFLAKWGSWGSGDGQFYGPKRVAVDAEGNVYVADGSNHRIQKFTADGVFLAQWGSKGSGDGQFSYPEDVAVDSEGNVYVADRYNRRIQKLTADGVFVTKWGGDDGQLSSPSGLTVDAAGNVYVADSGNSRIQKFTADGVFMAKWGNWGSEGSGDDPQVFYPPTSGLTVDAIGNVYVADIDNHRIQKFTADGVFLAQWGSKGSGDGQFSYPRDIAVDSGDNVYVADRGNYRIQKFTADGVFLARWGSRARGPGQLGWPSGLAADTAGNVYVADSDSSRIQKFTADGVFLMGWGTWGGGDGQFFFPRGLTVDAAGNVYVADTDNHRIQKFTADGVFLAKWGSEGSGDGQFNRPTDVAVDVAGNVYVADLGNDRIQVFSPQPTPTPTPTPAPGSAEARAELARRFAPIMRLHPEEIYEPIDVAILIDNSYLKKDSELDLDPIISTNPTAELLAGLTDSSLYLDLREISLDDGPFAYSDWYKATSEEFGLTVYVRVVGDGDQLFVQYWFFYAFNDWTNDHEGDWEFIQLQFNAESADEVIGNDLVPSLVAGSVHTSGYVGGWEVIERVGNHPVVYVALGSHATYLAVGDGEFTAPLPAIGSDLLSSEGPVMVPESSSAADLPPGREYEIQFLNDMPWVSFPGNWGERCLTFRINLGCDSPVGPAQQESKWKAPGAWSRDLRFLVTQAKWLSEAGDAIESVNRGTTVILHVEGTAPGGFTTEAEIREVDPLSPDDLIATVEIDFEPGVGQGTWPALWMSDGLFGGDPEYVFRVLGVDSAELAVR